jgi:uncharacterized membrane protein
MNDARMEAIIAYILRAGVLISALVVSAGGALYLSRHGAERPAYHVFHGEPEYLRTLHGLFSAQALQHGQGIIQLGLLLLVLTPVIRVAFSIFAFAAERDWLYVGLTAIVLSLLLYSLVV